jgi:L-arabinokinase
VTVAPEIEAFHDVITRSEFFDSGQAIYVSRAPGRLDLMGGIADYSGSLVLQIPIRAAAFAAVQENESGDVVAMSGPRHTSLPVHVLTDRSTAELSHLLAADGGWAGYVIGPVAVLAQQEGLELPGLRIFISSDVPEGRGVSSSAAVEVATIHAVADCVGRSIEARRLALLAQRAEHEIARAPCGVMDQLTAACGKADELLSILCRPAEILGSIPLRPPLAVWGIDSGVQRTVAGRAYGQVRCATFMGKQMLGLDAASYLTERAPSETATDRLPETVSGKAFLQEFGPVADSASAVDTDVHYPVRAAAVHALEEHQRVSLFAELLPEPLTDRRAQLLGELMLQSHTSYSRLGLGSPATDAIVGRVREAGRREGLIGARISGGGAGGTVAVLGREEAEPFVRSIARELGAGVIDCSSDGAAYFGIHTFESS